MHALLSFLFLIFPAQTFSAIANVANRRLSSSGTALYARSSTLSGDEHRQVELLRFVTAYRTGIEAVVDLTPYSPLIRAAAANGNLTMYSFIDTWVGNQTVTSHALYFNNVTHKCNVQNNTEGNGWGLSVDLLFWPKQKNVSKQPSESITIASGYYGGTVGIGQVSLHKGTLAENGSKILFADAPDLNSVDTGMVYDMNHRGDVGLASLLGYVAQQTELFTLSNNPSGVDHVTEEASEVLLESFMVKVHVTSIDEERRIARGSYNGSALKWEVGMPVFYDGSEIFTDKKFGNGWWMNSTMPMTPVGEITHADGKNLSILLNYSCLPSNATHNLPHLLIPASVETLSKVKSLVEMARDRGRSMAVDKLKTVSSFVTKAADLPLWKLREFRSRSPLLLVSTQAEAQPDDSKAPERVRLLEPKGTTESAVSLEPPALLGHLDIESATNASFISLLRPPTANTNASDGTSVIVITQQRHGLLLNRTFQLPDQLDESSNYLEEGARVIMQLAVTGHGWAATDEQCGEYCHAVYRISLNGKPAANVTQFRNDCKDNPIGPHQLGTWDESRNGWCPGTVVPGIFIDMTRHLRNGSNNLLIDLVVWSNATLQYEPYTDFAGFIYGDKAELVVNLNAFIFNKSTVETIQKQEKPRTAAEKAIMIGSSAPARLYPPDFVREPVLQDVLLQTRSKARGARREQRQHRPRLASHLNSFHPKWFFHKGLSFMGKPFDPVVLWNDEDERNLPLAPVPHDNRGRIARAVIRAEGGTTKNVDIHEHQRLGESTTHIGAQAEVKQMPIGYDFEGRAPWYLYNTTKEGPIEAIRYPVFRGRLMQSNSRHVEQLVANASEFPDWGHIAVHFRLHKPFAPLKIDHWDRLGSFGLKL